MTSFRWQGKDFGAWLATIARNLATDHFKAGRTRRAATEDMGAHDDATEDPRRPCSPGSRTSSLTALKELPDEQRDLIMRFLQGMSIAETAAVLGRSDGAVKQLAAAGRAQPRQADARGDPGPMTAVIEISTTIGHRAVTSAPPRWSSSRPHRARPDDLRTGTTR